MTRSAFAVAQAKINLGLRVLARDTSGYHQVETLFHRIELADEVRVQRTEGAKSLAVSGAAVPATGLGAPEANLAWRAAEVYMLAAGWTGGFAIQLEKRIPVGGGLGGGSADAGAVLRACDRLADRPLGMTRLLDLAATLGSDVPFLTSNGAAAVGWGRGERLLEVPALPARPLVLVVPPFAVATGEAYGWLAEARGSGPVPRPTPASDRAAQPDWRALESATNDFEPIVSARHGEIQDILRVLRSLGARPAMLSGSGSTVFGVFDGTQQTDVPRRLAALLPGMQIIWTRTATRVVPVAVTG